ncbi:TRAP transporter substrate-binding protein [Pseudahrensia aquimaris]|uniref:TRAP transporter substrate-binding protein n=1 Tax=Pseudahrensia aquimaris TaxID=744461 RepID=A0ABW3FEF6_9HYPH
MLNLTKSLKAGAMAAVLAVTAAGSALAADWRGWNIHPEGYPNTVALEQFAKDAEAATEGRVKMQVFNGGVLGSQPDAIEQIQAGAIDFANFNMGPMGPIVPLTNILSLPFLFTGVDQMHRAMDGAAGDAFDAAMQEKGIVALAWYDSGSRSLYNSKKPITQPADVEGMKFRVMNNQLFVDMIGAMGGNGTPMAFSEVFQSLKTGVIDGAENNYPSYESTNHFEAAKFYSITEHLIIPECVCVAKASWDKLSAEDQAAVKKAARDSAQTQRRLWAEREKASRKMVEAGGATVNEVADKAAFQAAMQPVYENYLKENPDQADFIKQIQGM